MSESRYISLGDDDKKEMLTKIGESSVKDLFRSIPADIRLGRDLQVPGPMSEPDLLRWMEERAGRNASNEHLSFLGGGAYPHFIPTVVDYLSSRGEFISPYTPYQPEVSQGTLQIIFEFQTLICQLTGMDISNASLYEGGSGTAEAVLMANRINRKSKILLPRSLHPHYKTAVQTYVRNLGLTTEEVECTETGRMDSADLAAKMDGQTSAVVCQSPNFFGVVEDLQAIADAAHSHQALFIVVVAEALSMGLLKSPGECEADIVTGELQSFGLPLSFGGPFLGFMACRRDYIRQFPGRIVGETRDVDGRRGYVLTLSTREQHIRRERATSNICTNQAYCALRATIFLEALGEEGLLQMSRHNVQIANYGLSRLCAIQGIEPRFSGKIFNEFVLRLPRPWADVDACLRKVGMLGGLGLTQFGPGFEDCVLVCLTEQHSKEDIDRLVKGIEAALSESGRPDAEQG